MSDFSREAVETRTRQALEQGYFAGVGGLGYERRVFDAQGRPQRMSRGHFQELQRKLKIFRWLDQLSFSSFIDIGSGMDIYPNLVSARYGVPAFFSDLVHALNLPAGGHASGKLDRAVTLNVARLPFADGAFDIVLASEVLEHLVRPVEAIAELVRVARRYVIMTSLEALSPNRWRRLLSHHRVDVRVGHVERNFLVLEEFAAIFGEGLRHENLLYNPNSPADPFSPEDEQQAVYAALKDVGSLEAALLRAIAISDHRPGAMGILLVRAMPGAELPSPRPDGDPSLARWLIEQVARAEDTGLDLLSRFGRGTAEYVDRDRPVAPALLARVRCPDCRGCLDAAGPGLRCDACGTTFPADFGVPILHPTRVPSGPAVAEECLRQLCGDDRSRRRIVRRLMRRLRRNEGPPSPLRRLAWRIEDRLLRLRRSPLTGPSRPA